MAQVKLVFFLPILDNDGRNLSEERSDAKDDLYLQFVAWTRLGIVQGAYRMADGAKKLDDHHAYAVLLDEMLIPNVEDVLRRFKSKTLQEAIYLEVQYHVDMRLI